MKVLKIFSFVLISVLLISCSKNSEEEIVDAQENSFIFKLTGDRDMSKEEYHTLALGKGVTVTCSGNCGCQVEWPIGSNVVRCTCSDCAMTIINDERITGDINLDSLFQSSFFKESKIAFDDYILKYFDGKINGIESMKAHFTEDENGVLIINFLDSENNLDSLLIRYSRTGTVVIRCIGTCGCIVEYNLDTNTASCSCAECDMHVEHKA